MKIQRLFSKKLPESRIGIGWMQEKLGKNDSEKYFKKGQEAADKSYEKGDSEDEIIRKSKKRARNSVILDKSGKPLLEGAIAGGAGYLATKSPGFIESAARMNGIDVRIPPKAKNILSKHSGKIAAGVGLVTAGRYLPKIYEQQKAVGIGMEINTKDRLKKNKKKKSQRQYSVLMAEDEVALFSNIIKDNKKELSTAAIGSGLIGGEVALSNKNSRIALRKGLRKLGKKKVIQDYNRSLVGSGVKVVDITPGPKMRKEILSKAKNTEKLINKGSKGLKYIGSALVLGSAAKALNSATKKKDKD